VKRSVQRFSWSVGEFVHRRLADRLTRTKNGHEASAPSDEQRPVTPSSNEVVDGQQPLRFRSMESVDNPVLTAADVTDFGDADFVADPFLFVSETEEWNLFFEVYNGGRRPRAAIAHATSEDEGRSWEYDRVVLRDDIHLAFPYIFEWKDSFYMVPDRWNRENPATIRLYRTDRLPGGWHHVTTLVRPDRNLADCVVFRWNDRWWAILGSAGGRRGVWAYYADDLLSDGWTQHERNPVVAERPRANRPAGRPIVGENRILFFFQDCVSRYGDKVRAYEINQLSPTTYADRERPDSPILEGSTRRLGWNSGRMHHVDPLYTPEGWICAVDGNIGFGRRAFGQYHWAIGMYRG
jgi:hypothetical protein